MLTLEPVARDKARDKEENDARVREAARKFDRLMGADPDRIEQAQRKPDPKRDEFNKRVEAMVRKERQRLLREARRSRS
jgi:hypothetical protein